MIFTLGLTLSLFIVQDPPGPMLASEAALEQRLVAEFPEVERVLEHELDNGWRFLILPREGAPVVSFETYVGVGSIDESTGRTGVAHLFEHMAFKGSDRIGTLDWEKERAALAQVETARARLEELERGEDEVACEVAREAFQQAQTEAARFVDREEFSRVLEEAGGLRSLNASTSADATRFVVSLPSNQLELWCWMEAERSQRPVLRELYSERDAILEERRLRVESSPFGSLLEALQLTAFRTHPYRNPVIGFREDIEALNVEKAQQFFDKYYTTGNRITAIIGDVDPEKLIPMLERTCGRAPKGSRPRTKIAPEEAQTGERRVQVDYPANPLLALGWHAPSLTDPFSPALEVVIRVLAQGAGSRLEHRLVREEGSVSRLFADTGWPGTRDSALAVLIAVPTGEPDLVELEAAILEEIALLTREGPTPEELDAAKVTARAELLRSMRDSAELASLLLEYEAKTGDWREAFRRIHKLEAVRAVDVQRVLERWFTRENMTAATLESRLERAEKE